MSQYNKVLWVEENLKLVIKITSKIKQRCKLKERKRGKDYIHPRKVILNEDILG